MELAVSQLEPGLAPVIKRLSTSTSYWGVGGRSPLLLTYPTFHRTFRTAIRPYSSCFAKFQNFDRLHSAPSHVAPSEGPAERCEGLTRQCTKARDGEIRPFLIGYARESRTPKRLTSL